MKISAEDLHCSDDAFKLMMSLKEHTIPDAERALSDLDAQVLEMQADPEYGEEHQLATLLLLQARNFFARFLERPQVGLPEGFHRNSPQEVVVLDPRAGKHVAIYGTKAVTMAVIGGIQNVPLSTVALKPYTSIKDLIRSIEANEVLGIVSVSPTGFTESSIRHDYKYFPGKTARDAEAVILPPIAELGKPPVLLLKIASVINAMYDGTYGITDAPFVLETELPLLLGRMIVPKKPHNILIIDDMPRQIEGIEKILRAWRNVTVSLCTVCNEAPDFHPDINLILLDEDLGGNLKGTVVHEQLKTRGYTGMVVSITGGPKPKHVTHHFGGKTAVATSREAAHQFVDFVNQLLVQLDSK